MARSLGSGARLIIGADLKKDVRRLISAYDDAAGVTAAFNLNLLERANRELDADFDLASFAHLATYDVRHGRIDMWLVSRIEQTAICWGNACTSPRTSASTPSIRTSTTSRASTRSAAAPAGARSRSGWMRSGCSACTCSKPREVRVCDFVRPSARELR